MRESPGGLDGTRGPGGRRRRALCGARVGGVAGCVGIGARLTNASRPRQNAGRTLNAENCTASAKIAFPGGPGSGFSRGFLGWGPNSQHDGKMYLFISAPLNFTLQISTSDRTHARTGPETPQAEAQSHTQNSNTRTHTRQTDLTLTHTHTHTPGDRISHPFEDISNFKNDGDPLKIHE